MPRNRSRIAIITALTLAGSGSHALANHRESCVKFADTNIFWHNGATGEYASAFHEEVWSDGDSWHNATVINFTPVGVAGDDTVRTHNQYNPNVTWRGHTDLQPYPGQPCVAKDSVSFLNELYLGPLPYTVKKHVACHEVGHALTLAHRDGNSCTNINIENAPWPDGHDIEQVAINYQGEEPPPGGECGHDRQCFPSLNQCANVCCGVCERRINCGGATAHKCFE